MNLSTLLSATTDGIAYNQTGRRGSVAEAFTPASPSRIPSGVQVTILTSHPYINRPGAPEDHSLLPTCLPSPSPRTIASTIGRCLILPPFINICNTEHRERLMISSCAPAPEIHITILSFSLITSFSPRSSLGTTTCRSETRPRYR